MTLRVVAISDTHCQHDALDVPEGDVLVHAGDFTNVGRADELAAFDAFLASLPHRHKIVIAGNHDFCFERQPEMARAGLTGCHYLEDSGVEIEGVRFYGSPWQPRFLDWAFNLDRGAPLREKWDLIPAATDVLITHGPPLGHGDTLRSGEPIGCADLLAAVERVRPRFHVFGHIHEGYGVTRDEHTTFINASSCDARYGPVNPPVCFEVSA